MGGCRRTCFPLAVAALTAAAGCGGSIPGLDPDELWDWYYGSIALNSQTFAGSITANQPSRETSDEKALELCGAESCMIVLRYSGKGVCGAIARAPNQKYGVGTGSSRTDATAKALDECQAQGGQSCELGLADCNG